MEISFNVIKTIDANATPNMHQLSFREWLLEIICQDFGISQVMEHFY